MSAWPRALKTLADGTQQKLTEPQLLDFLRNNEVSSGEWTLKTLADGTQQKLTEPQLLDFLRNL